MNETFTSVTAPIAIAMPSGKLWRNMPRMRYTEVRCVEVAPLLLSAELWVNVGYNAVYAVHNQGPGN